MPETPETAVVVVKLPETLLSHGHTLWMDNFYNSPELARQLKIEHSTACVGTLKLKRKNIPKEGNEKKLKKGETIVRYSGPVTVPKWHDNRSVTVVSIYHSADMQRVSKKGKEMQKPLYVTDYNCTNTQRMYINGIQLSNCMKYCSRAP